MKQFLCGAFLTFFFILSQYSIVFGFAPVITASLASGSISACTGTASASPNIQQFTVTGSGLTADITATAPVGFEVSLSANAGYAGKVLLNQSAGIVVSTIVYVRSAAADAPGAIIGKVVLSSAGAITQDIAVSGSINALPTINTVANQSVTAGTATTAVNFTGTGNVFTWTNNTPSIGLAGSGTGNISSFTATNIGATPVTATITATPISEGFAYITNSGDGTISVINVATNAIVTTITPPHDPFCVTISPDGSKAYVGCGGGSSTVTVINTSTNTIITTIPVSSTGESTGVTISPDGTMLYVANYIDNTVTAVNTVTGAVVAVIAVTSNPYGIAISQDGTRVYVAFTYSNYISVINTVTNKVINNITVGQAPQDVVVSPDGTRIYVPSLQTKNISVIDPKTNSVIAIIPTVDPPSVITLSPDGTTAYAATNTGNVLVINTANNAIIATIQVGVSPNGICVSPDGYFVYVANTASKNVSVINTSTNLVIAIINVGISPISLGNFVTAGTGCTGASTTFTITVKPAVLVTPGIIAGAASGTINSCFGTASANPNVQQFTVSGTNLTANISASAPAGFEISLDVNTGYSNSVTLKQSGGTVNSSVIYVRSSANAAVGNISGNVTLTSAGATNQLVPVSAIINAEPTVNSLTNLTVISGTSTTAINFTGTANTYNWVNDSPVIGLAASGTGKIPSFVAINNTSSPIIATVTVTPLNNNCDGIPITFTITVIPKDVSTLISIPNTFTPNGDGINDTWVIGGISNDASSEVQVFNRYGSQVFDSRGYGTPWNGEYAGKKLAKGVYYYIITANNGTKRFSGSLLILY